MAAQLMLFADLPVPPDAAEHLARRSRMWAPWRIAVQVLRRFGKRKRSKREPEQQALTWRLRALESDLDTPWDRPVHGVVKATEAEPLQVQAPVSIWALAQSCKGMKARGRFGDAAGFTPPAPYRVERDGGVTRHVRLRPDETPEWAEKERLRRAKQRPPKPVKKARTRSKKLLELIGNEDD